MKTILLFLIAFALQAQTFYNISNHAGLTATNATRVNQAGGGMVITTSVPHGFSTKAATADLKIAQPAAGDTFQIRNTYYRFVNSLLGCTNTGTVGSPIDIKRWITGEGGISANVANNRNVAGAVAAIEGTSWAYVYDGVKDIIVTSVPGTYYCSGASANADVNAYNRFGYGAYSIMGVRSKTNGIAGAWSVAETSSIMKWVSQYYASEPSYHNVSALTISWWVTILGASVSWAPVGQTIPGTQPATSGKLAVYVDEDEFRLPQVDSSAYSNDWATTQQANWRIVQSAVTGANNTFLKFLQSSAVGGVQTPEEGAKRVDVFNCTTSTSAEDCGKGLMSPDNSLGYGIRRGMAPTSVVVTSGVAVASFLSGSSWVGGNNYRPAEVDARVFLRGFQKYYLQHNISSITNNGSGLYRVTTATAHNCIAGTDQTNISGATGTGINGTFTITVISTTVVDLVGSTFASGASGGVLACNPGGKQANDIFKKWSNTSADLNYAAAYKITAIDTTTLTFPVPGFPDGEYLGNCNSPASTTISCINGITVYPLLVITTPSWGYFNHYSYNNSAANGTDQSTWPQDKMFFQAQESLPLSTPPQIHRYWSKTVGQTIKRPSSGSGVGFHEGTYPSTTIREDGVLYDSNLAQGHYYSAVQTNQYANVWRAVDFVGPIFAQGASPSLGERPLNLNNGEDYLPNASTYLTAGWETGITPTRSFQANLGFAYFSWPYSTAVSLDSSYPSTSYPYLGTSLYLGLVQAGVDANQPYNWVRNRISQWVPASPGRYATGGIGHNNPPSLGAGYEFSWSTVPNVGATFLTRWSTSATPLRTAGWSTGSTGGSCSGGGNGDSIPCAIDGTGSGTGFGYTTHWQMDRASQDSHMRLAVKPIVPIIASADAGQNHIVQFKDDLRAPSFQVGDSVTVAGAGGNRDGTKTISSIIARNIFFAYLPDHNTSAAKYTEAGTLTSISATAGVCTAEFSTSHGLVPGMLIIVVNTNNSTLGSVGAADWATAKKYTVATADSDTITFTCTGVSGVITNAGTCPGASCRPMMIAVPPGWVLNGTNTGSWSGAGTVMSNEENRGFAEIYLTPYTDVGSPVISLDTPSSVNLIVTEGQSGQVVIPFTSSGGALDDWNAVDNQTWASLSPASGTTAQDITVTVNAASLIAGSYSVTVTISSTTNGVTNTPRAVTVNVTVTASTPIPTLSLDTSTVSWTYTSGGSLPTNQNVAASCTSPGCEVTKSFTGCSWLTVTPTSGNTPQAFTFAANITGLDPGPYTCPVSLTGTGEVNNSPQLVTVSLTVLAPLNNVTIKTVKTSTKVLVRYQGAGLVSNIQCTVEAKIGESVISAKTDSGGGYNRFIELDGLTASTAYTIVVGCGSENGGTSSVTTKSSDSGGSVKTFGVPLGSATKLQTQYGATEALGTTVTEDCAVEDCILSMTRSANDFVYFRRRWLNSSDVQVIGWEAIRAQY